MFMEIVHSKHAAYEIGYHIIWCTKFRKKVIDQQVEVELSKCLHETCRAYGWTLSSFESMPDHVHLFVESTPEFSPREIAQTLKSISALTLFRTFPTLKKNNFWGSGMWSRSTYYGSVGHVSESTVRKYIETQKERG